MVFRAHHLFSAAVSSVAILLPSVASAVGLEVSGRVGYGSAGSESPVRYEPSRARLSDPPDSIWRGESKPYGGGLVLQGALGLRAGKFVSVGLGGGIRGASAETPSDVSDVTRSSWNAGPYVRVYLPFVPIFEPYVGLGVEYVSDTQKYKAPVRTSAGNIMADWTLEHHGVAVPLTLGVDYTVAKVFSFGPSFQYSLVFPAGACAKVNAMNLASTNFCASESDDKRLTAGKGYGVWSIGLQLRLTFPPA